MFTRFSLTMLVCFNILNANYDKFSISSCISNDLKGALICKKNILLNSDFSKVFIIKYNNTFYTYLNLYNKKELAFVDLNNLPDFLKKTKPFVVQLNKKAVQSIDENSVFINLNNNQLLNGNKQQKSLIPILSFIPSDLELLEKYYQIDQSNYYNKIENKLQRIVEHPPSKVLNKENKTINKPKSQIKPKNIAFNDKIKEEIKQVSMDEFDKSNSLQKKKIEANNTLSKEEKNTIDLYDNIIIDVSSKTNIMNVQAITGDKLIKLNTYKVSTGKKNVKKPFGEGRISAISLNPTWYPTTNTIKRFEKKGIILPKVIPPGHKYNFMGAAKLNLTHVVDGEDTYRIHGTLNERTIGRNESAGCIRMKNDDVVALAKMLKYFSSKKGLKNIKVTLN